MGIMASHRVTVVVGACSLALLVLAGCSGHMVNGRPTTGSESVTPVSRTPVLVPARHPECVSTGMIVLSYLRSGDNKGNPNLDLVYAQQVGVDEPQARAIASRAVQQCDQYYDNEQATRAQEAANDADAAERASEDAASADRRAAACTAVKGILMEGGGACASYKWQSDSDCFSWMGFDSDDNIDKRDIARMPSKCIR